MQRRSNSSRCPNCGDKNEYDLDELFPAPLGDPQAQDHSNVLWCPTCGTISEQYGDRRMYIPSKIREGRDDAATDDTPA